jgi:hypothetical protein
MGMENMAAARQSDSRRRGLYIRESAWLYSRHTVNMTA